MAAPRIAAPHYSFTHSQTARARMRAELDFITRTDALLFFLFFMVFLRRDRKSLPFSFVLDLPYRSFISRSERIRILNRFWQNYSSTVALSS